MTFDESAMLSGKTNEKEDEVPQIKKVTIAPKPVIPVGEYCQNEPEDEESSDPVEENIEQAEERFGEQIQKPKAAESIAKNRPHMEI